MGCLKKVIYRNHSEKLSWTRDRKRIREVAIKMTLILSRAKYMGNYKEE